MVAGCLQRKEQGFVLNGISSNCDMDLFFLPTMLLSKSPSVNIQDALSVCHGIPHSIAFDQRISFTANEEKQWAQAYGLHWSYHVPHYSKVAGLREQ